MQLSDRRFKRRCRSRLTARSTTNGAITHITRYAYDAMGRRIQSSITRQVQGAAQTATVQYLYEGAQALGEIRDGRLSHRLLTGLSLDETIARIAITTAGAKDQAASRIFLTDALNSVIAQMSDSDDSTLQTSYAYSPYGASTTVGTDPANNPIQYTSRENDGTGLIYYRARYYDPVLGSRFISEDPIGLRGGPNGYAYVGGNPITYVDLEGKFAVIGAGVGAVVGGVFGAIQAANSSGGFSSANIQAIAFGAVTGAAQGAFSGFTGGLFTTMLGSAFVSGASNAINQLATGPIECFNFQQVAAQTLLGGVASKMTGFIGPQQAIGFLRLNHGVSASAAINFGQTASVFSQNAISQGANLVLPTSLGGFR